MPDRDSSGEALEARAQRLFLAQGIFAERYLRVSAFGERHKKTATDVDVLLSEFSSAFHLNLSHVECKSGKKFHILDRVFWMQGVKSLLGAGASYLVLSEHDPDVLEFAKNLGIELLTLESLKKMEDSYGIPDAVWPCRSNHHVFSPLLRSWRRAAKDRTDDKAWSGIGEMLEFLEGESWLRFRYGLLNKLLRYYQNLAVLVRNGALQDEHLHHLGVYCAGALAVRFSQYLMFMSRDVLTMGSITRAEHLRGRLTHGDQDPRNAQAVVKACAQMIKTALAEHDVQPPLKWEPDTILSPPPYADRFIELVERIIQSPSESKYATIATEVHHFGTGPETLSKFARLGAAVRAGAPFAALIRGFLIQTFNLSAEILAPFEADKALNSVTQTDKQAQGRLMA